MKMLQQMKNISVIKYYNIHYKQLMNRKDNIKEKKKNFLVLSHFTVLCFDFNNTS